MSSEIPGEDYQGSTTGSNASLDYSVDTSSDVLSSLGEMNLAEALEYNHPDYDAWKAKWQKFIDCYEANDIYRFIHRHGRESEDRYKLRVKRGYYFNYVKSVVDLFIAYLFHAPITRDVEDTGVIADVYNDADLKGTGYEHFIKTSATFAQIVGHVGVLVDAPRVPENGYLNERSRKDAGHRPYLVRIHADAIRDWELDRHGKFEWVKILVDRPSGRSWKRSTDKEAKTYVIWTKENWTEYLVEGTGNTAEAKIVASDEHNLGEVPLVIIRNSASLSHPWFGISSVHDICDIALAILNWCSFGDEEICERCLNILAMEGSLDKSAVELGHNNILEFSQCEHAPFYLTPGETPLKLIGEWIERGKDEIYRLAKLGGSTGLLGVREATSGIAYAYEFNETNQSLAQKAEFLEQGERDIHRLVYKWMGEDFAGTISYPREFGVEDFLMELEILLSARTNFTSTRAIKEIEKNVARKMFSKHPQELRNEIQKEIEQANAKPVTQFGFDNVPSNMFYINGGDGTGVMDLQDTDVPPTTDEVGRAYAQ